MVRLIALFALAVVVSTSVGCPKAGVDFNEHNDTNVERVRSMYSMFMESNSMRGPKDKDELKKFITTNNRAKALMKRIGLDPEEFDNYFIGTRDEEEIVVRWGLKGLADHAIAFEKTGVDGMRLVCFGVARELDEEEYEGYLDGSIKPEAPAGETFEPEEEERVDTTNG